MATKRQSGEFSKPNKIRFVLLEADLSDNNLSELTAAIIHALRPAVPTRQMWSAKERAYLRPGGANPATREEDVGEVIDTEFDETPLGAEDDQNKPTTPRTKKFKAPTLLNDLDLAGSGVTFKEFAEQKKPNSKAMKYLVAMFWLKEYGNSTTTNADKIYTCFKKAKWATNFNDWGQPFHNLVFADDIRKIGTGEFAINTTGEDKVNSGEA